MSRRAWFVLALCLLGLLSGCPKGGSETSPDRRGDVNGHMFEFSTAGSEHTDEHGAWLVRVRGDAMWIALVKDGNTTEFGPYNLSGKDADKLWSMVEELDLLGRSSKKVRSKRTPIYQLTLLRPKLTAYTVIMPMEAGLEDEAVASVVIYLTSLIKRYTEEKPVLTPPRE